MDLELLVTAPEFALWTEGRATVKVITAWRLRGKIQVRGYRGRSPLFRFGDLLDVEKKTRRTVEHRGGRVRKVKRQQSSAA